MPSTSTDMLDGLSASVAVKAPCRVASTSNITLAGLQTISAVVLVEDDRVLVTGQTDATENGIYAASSSDWVRTKDADGNRDLVHGTRVLVQSSGDGIGYELVTDDPIVIGTTELEFVYRDIDSLLRADLASAVSGSDGSRLVGFRRTESGSAARTVYAKQLERPSLLDFGAVGNNNGTATNGTNDTTAVTAAVTAFTGKDLDGAGRSYRVSATLPAPSVPAGTHIINGEFVSDQMVTTQDEYSITKFGWKALQANTYIPEQHAASGGRFFASGNHIVAIGREALKANTTGRRNTAVGSRALLANTTGLYNTAIGSHALEVCIGAESNTAVGVQALQATSTGIENTAIGVGAGLGISTGRSNTACGLSAVGGSNGTGTTVGDYNTGVGYRALSFVTSGLDNTAVGRDSAVSLTTGSNNTAVGGTALTSLLVGSNNTAVGGTALRNATGSDNTAVGVDALLALSDGLRNAALGKQAGNAATSADDSVFVGYRAGLLVTTGDENVCVGRNAGGTITTGGTNTMVGPVADTIAASANSTSLGNGATSTASNQVTLGNSSIATLRCQQTTITALSDARYKKNVATLAIPEGFFEDLRMVSFEWDNEKPVLGSDGKFAAEEDGKDYPPGVQVGVIAQELDALQTKYGVEWLGLVDKTNPHRWEATPFKLFFPLLQRTQEIERRARETEQRVAALEESVRKLIETAR